MSDFIQSTQDLTPLDFFDAGQRALALIEALSLSIDHPFRKIDNDVCLLLLSMVEEHLALIVNTKLDPYSLADEDDHVTHPTFSEDHDVSFDEITSVTNGGEV